VTTSLGQPPVPARPGHDPSRWPRRITIAVLALAGAALSLRLALTQYGLAGPVWDPLFGNGSQAVLTSAFSKALPVRDSALGTAAYTAEALLAVTPGPGRWRRHPWLVLLSGALTAAMATTALVLIGVQALAVHAFCTLCLVSAAISLTVPLLAGPEVAAAARTVRIRRHAGQPWRTALRGEPGSTELTSSGRLG
jgi:uncharacterized membrane protein